jgi:HlyD family secretion protein
MSNSIFQDHPKPISMKSYSVFIAILAAVLFTQCSDGANGADAYGNFETDEVLVSSESNGKLLRFSVEEGQKLEAGAAVAVVDTVQQHLQKQQLLAKVRAIKSKSPDISSQLAVFTQQIATSEEQLRSMEREKRRVENLLKADAATPKQLDDITSQIDVLKQQMEVIRSQQGAQKRGLSIQQNAVLQEAIAVQTQIAQLDDQIRRCVVKNPLQGTVTATYAEPSEVVAFGKPLYKIAGLDKLTLRAYVSGDQLVEVKIGQQVTVLVDAPDGAYQEHSGTVQWISEEAEFTPKVIQTKKDRVNLVYAMKVEVENDGSLKVGMPGEVKF